MTRTSTSRKQKYDLTFRPGSYWGPQNLQSHYGARAKGELRRQAAQNQLSHNIADPVVLEPSLSDVERKAVGSIHPWLMGGEYLPDFLRDEVEIARVVMKSTTMDVISIRARPTKHRIIYRIEDEYGDLWDEDDAWGHYVPKPKTSTRPLTLKQMIDIIDYNELVDGPRNLNYEDGGSSAEELYDFCTVSSVFYPQLEYWFDDANQRWLDNEIKSKEGEGISA